MSAPATLNITLQRHATFYRRVQLKSSTNVPLDITGYEVKAQIWRTNGTTKMADFTIEYIDRTQGIFDIIMDPVTSQTVDHAGVWDLLLITPTGTRDYWIRGTVTPVKGYTA